MCILLVHAHELLHSIYKIPSTTTLSAHSDLPDKHLQKKSLEKNLFRSLQSKYRTENEVLTREAKLVAPKMLSVIIRTFMKQNLLKTVSN